LKKNKIAQHLANWWEKVDCLGTVRKDEELAGQELLIVTAFMCQYFSLNLTVTDK